MSSLATRELGALLAGWTQDTRLLRLTTPLGADVLLAESVRGCEAIDEGFRFEVDALSTDAKLALTSLVGQPALLQLLTVSPELPLRPFHGYITAAQFSGANGGFARYRLRLEPWTAFLGVGRDSRVFQNQSVCDIVDTVFRAWRGKGRVSPAWRFDLVDRSSYPIRSLTTQYQESDLAFVQRLLHAEGLFWRFEHTGAPDAALLGSHVMVIADHNRTFSPGAQPRIPFRQAGAVMSEDSLDSWQTHCRDRADAVELSSWDYASRIDRPVVAGGGAADLAVRRFAGHYAWPTRAHGERLAHNALLALDTQRERHSGTGTVRTLGPGTTFTVLGNTQLDTTGDKASRTFVALGVTHLMHNNFTADIRKVVEDRLGGSALAAPSAEELGGGMHAASHARGERALYRMRVEAIRSSIAYRPHRLDQLGRERHPKPTPGGQQTAIVVGPAGSVIHTDRDHRIKVQFHWQRGAHSQSRLPHPAPDGHTGAPSDDSAGTWVRVATPLGAIAGANWGSNAIPRVGQEVLVDFLDGDIDRPVVIGSLYNGRGETDAQHNRARYGAGGATGNAPAWFPGQAGAHAHQAAVSGIKSQAMASSAEGGGAYSQLVFDGSSGRARTTLQHHARPHAGTAELNLGHLRHQVDNQHLQPAGFGAELKTQHSVGIRAGQGMLVSAERTHGSAHVLESQAAQVQIEQAEHRSRSLAETARQHAPVDSVEKDNAATWPALDQLAHSAATIKGSPASGSGYREPQLQLSSPAGIVATSATSAVINAGNTTSVSAGHDLNFATQRNFGHAVAAGIGLFTYGKSTQPGRPDGATGIGLHAASGTVTMHSQSAATRLIADRAITVASVAKEVSIRARQHVLLTAAGAAIRLEGGNITLQGPGTIEFKAGLKEFTGPKNGDEEPVVLPKPSKLAQCPARLDSAAAGGAGVL